MACQRLQIQHLCGSEDPEVRPPIPGVGLRLGIDTAEGRPGYAESSVAVEAERILPISTQQPNPEAAVYSLRHPSGYPPQLLSFPWALWQTFLLDL